MRTIITICLGIFILLVMRLIGFLIKHQSGKRFATILFFPIWFLAMGWNMYHGVQQGYSVGEESVFFLLNFGIPCFLAIYFLYKNLKRTK